MQLIYMVFIREAYSDVTDQGRGAHYPFEGNNGGSRSTFLFLKVTFDQIKNTRNKALT